MGQRLAGNMDISDEWLSVKGYLKKGANGEKENDEYLWMQRTEKNVGVSRVK